MADGDTTTPPVGIDPDLLRQVIQMQQQLAGQNFNQPYNVGGPPVERTGLSLFGEALGGGAQPGTLTPAQEEASGRQALLNFGMQMLAQSGYHPIRRTLGESLAYGLSGAQQAMQGTQEANIALQQKQQQMQIERMKAVEPLLNTAMLLQKLKNAQMVPVVLGQGGTLPGGKGGNLADYTGFITSTEGLGADPRSSAVGGFLDSTWNDFVKANPTLFAGMTPAQISAARSNPQINSQAVDWYARNNAPVLDKAGIPVTGQTLGLAHRLGPQGMQAVWKAPDSAKVADLVGKDAGAQFGDMTVGQLKARYAGAPTPGFVTASTKPAPTGATTAAPAAPAVQEGGPAPAPPGATTAASTGPYTGGGIGAVIGVPPTKVGGAGLQVNPQTGGVGTPNAGGLGTGPRADIEPTTPEGRQAALMGGVQLGQATQPVPGTGLTAGTGAAKPATMAPPASEAGWGTGKPSTYDIPGTPVGAQPPAPAATTPPPPPSTTQPPPEPVPDEKLSWPQFHQKYLRDLTAQEIQQLTVTPKPEAIANAQSSIAQAQAGYAYARSQGDTAGMAKAQEAFNAANKELGDIQREADQATAQNIQKARDARDAEVAKLYSEAQQRGAQVNIEKIKAGLTLEHDMRDKQAAAGEARLTDLRTASQKARDMNAGLMQMSTLFNKLPESGLVNMILHNYPGLATMARLGGVDPTSTDSAALINGLTSYMSTNMKPAGLGAMREYEFDAFKSSLPSLLQDPLGRRAALGYLLNLNDRIMAATNWTGKHFERDVPDTMNPGQPRTAFNLAPDYEDRMDKELGDVVPHLPQSIVDNRDQAGRQKWLDTYFREHPGRPYYDVEAVSDPSDPTGKTKLRDANGNVITQEVEMFAPLPGEKLPWRFTPGAKGSQ